MGQGEGSIPMGGGVGWGGRGREGVTAPGGGGGGGGMLSSNEDRNSAPPCSVAISI